jgi:hypothetical protein
VRPPSGSMCHWRFKGQGEWRFGYCTYERGYDLVRMGRWNGDTIGGSVVSISEVEWKPC